jgi:hypothetical protein
MERVTALILHMTAGLLVGSLFGVQTLVVLVFAVFVEAVAVIALRGLSTGLLWILVGQMALQFGYLGGVCLRSILERAGIILVVPHRGVVAPHSRRSESAGP